MYIDGVSQGEKTTDYADITISTHDLRIGAASSNASYITNGIIDEFRVYDSDDALTTLAQGGDTADSDEYLFSEVQDYTLDLKQLDTNNRGEYLYLGSDSMFSGINVDLETVGAVGSAASGLFNINHEGNNLDEYDSTATDGGDLSTGTPGLESTAAKMEALIDDTNGLRGTKNITLSTNDVRLRFYFDPNSITADAGEDCYIVGVCDASAEAAGCLWKMYWEWDGASHQLAAGIWEDDESATWIGPWDITDTEHYVEVYGERASSGVAGDGRVRIWIDGAAEAVYDSGAIFDNYDMFLLQDVVYVGVFNPQGTPGPGTLYLDEIKANTTGAEIGAWAAEAVNLDWEYWDGDSWADLESISGFTDGTSQLTADGAIYWDENPTNWRPYSVNGSTDLYYIRCSVNPSSGSYTTSPIENFIKTDILTFQYLSNITASDQTLVIGAVSRPQVIIISEKPRWLDPNGISIRQLSPRDLLPIPGWDLSLWEGHRLNE